MQELQLWVEQQAYRQCTQRVLVHEPRPWKGGHWYHKKVQIIIVIFDKVYVCTTYFCMIAVCM